MVRVNILTVAASRRSQPYVALIGDMVQSRALPAAARAKAQQDFSRLVALLNRRFANDIASKFVVTIGDEFQGLLWNAEVIPDIVWLIDSTYGARAVRIGIGYGVLHTPLQKIALNIDGPVLHEARTAILVAHSKRLLGGVFSGFGEYDDVLLGFAQALRYLRANLTKRQLEAVSLLREGKTQAAAAKKIGVTKQSVSERVVAGGWEPYRLGEIGWRKALALATARVGGEG